MSATASEVPFEPTQTTESELADCGGSVGPKGCPRGEAGVAGVATVELKLKGKSEPVRADVISPEAGPS
jgi:hypothetical protein